MSNARQETVVDIVAQMRQDIADGTVGIWSDFGGEIARVYADRIEAAHKREVAELRAENDRLRAALKPVLECKVMSAMTAEIKPGKSEYCASIIEKAQHIYNEGEENQNEGGAK